MMQFDNLVCIYTCERHREFLRAFYRSAPGRYLLRSPSTGIFEVYADSNIPSSFLDDKRIVVRAAESYGTLSLKTFEMVRFCVENFKFERLIKIDVTIMQRRFDQKEFIGRKALDLAVVEKFLSNLQTRNEYDGLWLHKQASHEEAIAWAAKKGGQIDYDEIFGSDPMPPYYGGKCYSIGRAFADFIAEHGALMAFEYAAHLMGAEDVMIGRLYQMFVASSPVGRSLEGHCDASQVANSKVESCEQSPYGLFDSEWYLANNPDVREAGGNPLEHYVCFGAAQRRDPHPLFDTEWYLARYPDVRLNGANPLEHYVLFGAAEGRDPNPLFDTDWYLARYPDVGQSGVNPLEHYVRFGAAEGRDPNPLFDTNWYLSHNSNALDANITPLEHYLRHGVSQGSSPHPLFDPNWYLAQNPDVRALGSKPLVHYVQFGAAEGRNPHPLFDSDWYLSEHPDARDQGLYVLDHFMRIGALEGANPHPLFWTGWYLRTYDKHLVRNNNALVDYIWWGARAGRHPNPLFALAGCSYDEGGQWFQGLYRVVSPTDIADFVGSVVGRAQLTDDWGALLRAYVEGDCDSILRLIAKILSTATRADTLYSPARATLFRLMAECLLSESRISKALESAKQSVMLAPESESSLDVLRKCLLARDLVPAPKPNLIVLLISCEKYQERALSTYQTLVSMGLFVKVIVGAQAAIHVEVDFVRVSAGDHYEDLPQKIRDAINWVYETYGAAVDILKVDDDLRIADTSAFSDFVSSLNRGLFDYVGNAAGSARSDNQPMALWRDWHFGKCQDDLYHKPYGKRSGRRYSQGPIYYLSGTAIEKFYEFVHRYPGEIAGEFYEDLFVGKVMEASGIKLKDVRYKEMGLVLESLIW